MKRTVSVAAVAAALPTLAVAQGFIELEEVVLLPAATPIQADRTGASVSVIDAEDLATTADTLLIDALDRLPGVGITSSGGPGTLTNLRLRGADYRYVGVYRDGFLVNDPSAPTGEFDDFGGLSAGAVTRIEVLKGSQSALYGSPAVGGVVDIRTLPLRDAPDGVSGRLQAESGSYDTFSAAASVTQNTGPLSLSVTASAASSNGFSAADENDGNTEADGWSRTRLAFGAEYDLGPDVTLGATIFAETGRTEYDGFVGFTPGDTDNVSERDANGQRLYALWRTGSVEHETSISRYSVERTELPVDSVFEGQRLHASHISTLPVTATTDLSFGLDWRRDEATYPNLDIGTRSRITRGVFAEARVAVTPGLNLLATLRYDDDSQFGSFDSQRLAASYRATEALTLRAAIATGYRAPSIDQLYGEYPAFGFAGNPDLQPEESLSYEVGADLSFGDGGMVSATLFRSEVDNLIVSTDDFTSLENATGETVRQGLEFGVEAPVGPDLTIFASATYLDTERANGLPLDGVAEREAVIGATWRATDRLAVTGSVSHVSDYTVFGAEAGDFTVVDAAATYSLSDRAEAYFRVENLFDQEYQTNPGYGTSDRAYYAGFRARF